MITTEPGSAINLDELRGQLAMRVALVPLIGAAVLGIILSARRQAVPAAPLALLVGLIVTSVGVWLLTRRHPVFARYLLMLGLTVLLVGAMWVSPAAWLPFCGLSLVFVGAMLMTGGEVVTAALIGGAAVWLASRLERDYPIPALLTTLALAAILAWLMFRTLYTALEWAWTMQQQADQLLELARDRQGQLARTLKTLDNSNIILRRTQAELIAARRQADEARIMKEQFAANVSHELRTPLNIILGFSELMSLSPEVYGSISWPATLKQDVNQIYRSARHLLDMIDDILDLSRFEIAGFTLNKESISPSLLLWETADMAKDLFDCRAVTLETDIPDDLPLLRLDRIRIRQVLINLLANAARFTEKGRVRVAARCEDDALLVSVSDTGLGISPDMLPHLFEEFFQVDRSLSRKHSGAGLGLAISKRFVEAHGGRIWVESAQGAGATFFFSLPLADREAALWPLPTIGPADLRQTEAQPPVLVVDSDPAVIAMVDRCLTEHRAIKVESLETLAESVLLYHPRAVIVNVPPERTVPVELPLQVSVPVIQCSLPSQAWVAQDLNVAGCLIKPVTAERLLDAMARLGALQEVLVIDDDRGFCLLVERMLLAHDPTYRVQRCYDGEAGLRHMRRVRPDLVLLDLMMPGLDGFAVLEAMHADVRLADVPVILLTATSLAEDALLQQRGQMLIRRPEGLPPAEALRCLQAVVGVLEPNYDERAVPQIAFAQQGVI